jgi:DNA-binding NtrC family response regulator
MKGSPALIVESHPRTRDELGAALLGLGYGTVVATSVDEALSALAQQDFAFCLLDTRLAGGDGLDLLRRLRAQGNWELPVILLADERDLPRVTEATALGADDFLQKSFTPVDLENVVKETLARPRRRWGSASHDPEDAAARLRSEVDLWRSPRMREVLEIIQQGARVDVTVLIVGETGTGKDLVARAIHQLSVRRAQPFVKVNCAAVPR